MTTRVLIVNTSAEHILNVVVDGYRTPLLPLAYKEVTLHDSNDLKITEGEKIADIKYDYGKLEIIKNELKGGKV